MRLTVFSSPRAPGEPRTSAPSPVDPTLTVVSSQNASIQLLGSCIPTVCKIKPRYSDGTRTYTCCGMTCANKMKATVPKQNLVPRNHDGSCQVPNCTQPVLQTLNGPAKYCSQPHKVLAETACLWCRLSPKKGDRHFCSTACATEAQNNAAILLEIPAGHVTYKDIVHQFQRSWRHDTYCPSVKYIYKIVSSKELSDKYDAYKAKVESRGHFAVQTGLTAGNENRRWHGTLRKCNIGDKGETQLCSSDSCSLCCIIRKSYQIILSGKNTGWGRFGDGVYTSSTSSKSNDYSKNEDSTSPLKGMLLNKVVVGLGYKLTENDSSLTKPRDGYDSVIGEVGGKLNYDELVVYNNDAIRPSYLVMYEAA
ncbi:hypothetical protein IEO21_06190 [Rhodonia placenta]|uniref:PARP catalytic domain-containing protein n=1 Tax=Rhodonia placenta TaxID=104341 RepID=A0A8H7U1J6_9APHY|nr:hypothetical protein IEO21_06190 [Postia placenta]